MISYEFFNIEMSTVEQIALPCMRSGMAGAGPPSVQPNCGAKVSRQRHKFTHQNVSLPKEL
jgi:hypothetical protein